MIIKSLLEDFLRYGRDTGCLVLRYSTAFLNIATTIARTVAVAMRVSALATKNSMCVTNDLLFGFLLTYSKTKGFASVPTSTIISRISTTIELNR